MPPHTRIFLAAAAVTLTCTLVHAQGRTQPRRPTPPTTQAPTAQGPAASRPIENRRVITTGRLRGNAEKPNSDQPLLPVNTGPTIDINIPADTPITVKITTAIDSAHAKNNDAIAATLAAPVANLPIGTPVQLVVVAVSKAGQLSSWGELSVQILFINGRNFLSKTVTAQGKEGKKDLPDSAPAPGTEAALTPETPLTLPAA